MVVVRDHHLGHYLGYGSTFTHGMTSRKETMMTPEELRVQALQCAVGHRLSTETAKDVVENAEKYFAFLNKPAT